MDVTISGLNMAMSTYYGTLIGSALCPGLGTVAGAAVGFIISVGVGYLVDWASKEPRRRLKSWVN